MPTPAIAERPSSQPRQNPERRNPSPGAPRRPLGMLRCQAGSQLRAALEPHGFLLLPRPPPPEQGAGAWWRRRPGAPAAAAAAAWAAAAATRPAPARRSGCGASSRRATGTGTDTLAGTRGGTRKRLGRDPPLHTALDPFSALAPQLPASCLEAHGKSWLRLWERVAGGVTEAEGPFYSPSGAASWSNFSQRCLCLGMGRHLFRMRALPWVSERSCLWEMGSGSLSQVRGAALQPRAPGRRDAVALGCNLRAARWTAPGWTTMGMRSQWQEWDRKTSCEELSCVMESLDSKLWSPKK